MPIYAGASTINRPGALRSRRRIVMLTLCAGALAVTLLLAFTALVASADCEYWVAAPPKGHIANSGKAGEPWPTLHFAAQHVPDDHCTVWVEPGVYEGEAHFVRRFKTETVFRAAEPYQVVLENAGKVLNFDGAKNIVIEGFRVRHTGPSDDPQVVKIDQADDQWSEYIVLRNNIFHDSYNDDILKIFNGARFITVEGNIFYNQAPAEEHIDINSVTDITVQDNIFFNDFAGSDRPNDEDTKSFITVKDSNGDEDGQIGAERIFIRRNIFLNYEGGKETLIQIGNDGKPYYEAVEVRVENNLVIGNNRDHLYAGFGVRGARDVVFSNNTIVGDLPASSYGFWISQKGDNPVNRDIHFYNNIWADPAGTMGKEGSSTANRFSTGDPGESTGVLLDNNLYWNGGSKIPRGSVVTPLKDDPWPIDADPLLNADHRDVILPRWDGSAFLSGNTSIRAEFVRLVEQYAGIPADSPAVDAADPELAPADDILGRPRIGVPDLGAFEYHPTLRGSAGLTRIWLSWPDLDTAPVDSLAISLTDGLSERLIDGIPAGSRTYTLTDLEPFSLYAVTLTAQDKHGEPVTRTSPLVLMTTDTGSFSAPAGIVDSLLRQFAQVSVLEESPDD